VQKAKWVKTVKKIFSLSYLGIRSSYANSITVAISREKNPTATALLSHLPYFRQRNQKDNWASFRWKTPKLGASATRAGNEFHTGMTLGKN